MKKTSSLAQDKRKDKAQRTYTHRNPKRHITLACVDKLQREMKDFGYPPVFPDDTEGIDEAEEEKIDPINKRPKKVKNMKYQWNIMKMMDFKDEEIKMFANIKYWLEYFPPAAMSDLRAIGVKVDWRRSFITTDVNPYFDSFVRWHFETLRKHNKVKFGKKHTIYCIKDGQPCMDHDRISGEGVGPQEYTLIKMKMVEPYPAKLKGLAGQPVFLVAATLRPETMYGQTNCWVHPDMKYIAFKVVNGEVFISTRRSALNMAYQDITAKPGEIEEVATITGQDIMGVSLKAPLTPYDIIYTLPMLTIKDDKGTGVVTSVPSDAPDDYAALRDLQKNEAFRKKFSITDEMVMPFKLVPIIEVPEMGDLCAVKACDEFQVVSQNDADKLTLAKEKAYQKGFYEGVFLVGICKGEKVQTGKKKVQKLMIDSKEAVLYQEPEKTVISRSGDRCIVALCDQWYLDYGEETWKKEAAKCLSGLETYSPETTQNFEGTLDRLQEHACSRLYGPGTKIPWDQQYIIESLSDSTIYMAYYTVCHLLQGGVINGSQSGKYGIRAEQLTTEIWNYIFFGGDLPKDSGISEEALHHMRREFQYWYPVDLRVSANDLVRNHLTYSLYNHTAVWPKPAREDASKESRCFWPKAVRSNGNLLLNYVKMGKSTGNFLTLFQAVQCFSADGTRLSLADAGDTQEDANFVFSMAETGLLRLYFHIEWTKEMLDNQGTMRNNPPSEYTYLDQVFESEINNAIKLTDHYYSCTLFREAMKSGFYDLQSARDRYRDLTAVSGRMNWDLIQKFIKVQAVLLAPVCPHVCEHVWKLIGETDTIMKTRWPTLLGDGAVNEAAIEAAHHLIKVTHEFRVQLKKMLEMNFKFLQATTFKKPSYGVVYVARHYPDWQKAILKKLRSLYNEKENSLPPNNDISAHLENEESLKEVFKKVVPFVQHIKNMLPEGKASALEDVTRFNEKEVLENHSSYIVQALELDEIWIEDVENATDKKVKEDCIPGKPISVFTSDPHKPFCKVTAASPQVGSGYFSYPIMVYEGDTVPRVVDRIKRTAGVPGDKPVDLLMHKDPKAGSRRLPTLDYHEVACVVPSSGVFTLKDDDLWVGLQQVGSQILYTVPES
ncbi:leucine--tRNA ligase, cytoplasmic-like isoform X2 [Dysidea avara]|uniref:leucine--tRNA ligase, cytoplasmic-like isoform X2 n=1 Tax=Dysidea avara TaxID=196820 RepID=UPI003332B59C